MPFESCPAWKSSLAGDYELRVTKLQVLRENVIVRGAMEARMRFPDALRRSRVARSMLLQQVFGLVLEMIEIGIRWEASYWHDELPFVCPRSALKGRK